MRSPIALGWHDADFWVTGRDALAEVTASGDHWKSLRGGDYPTGGGDSTANS
jgi:hypothetical protein